jgi:hypothetical protein
MYIGFATPGINNTRKRTFFVLNVRCGTSHQLDPSSYSADQTHIAMRSEETRREREIGDQMSDTHAQCFFSHKHIMLNRFPYGE